MRLGISATEESGKVPVRGMPCVVVCHFEVCEFLSGWLEGVVLVFGGFLLVFIVWNRILVDDLLLRDGVHERLVLTVSEFRVMVIRVSGYPLTFRIDRSCEGVIGVEEARSRFEAVVLVREAFRVQERNLVLDGDVLDQFPSAPWHVHEGFPSVNVVPVRPLCTVRREEICRPVGDSFPGPSPFRRDFQPAIELLAHTARDCVDWVLTIVHGMLWGFWSRSVQNYFASLRFFPDIKESLATSVPSFAPYNAMPILTEYFHLFILPVREVPNVVER